MKPIMKWLRRNMLNILCALVLMTGIGLLAYPTVSDYWNRMHQSQALSNYFSVVQDISREDYSAYLEAARAYNETLYGNQDSIEMDETAWTRYVELLDPSGTGIMGYVSIPKINVKLPVYHGTGDEVLQVAAGHLFGSSLPVGGQGTHACISGHTGLPRAALFTDLVELETGDTFMLQVMGELLTYEIDQIKVVDPDDVSDLLIDRIHDYCTLITCTPYGVNSHRLLVRGTRVPNAPEDEETVKQILEDGFDAGLDWKIICAAAALTAAGIVVLAFWLKARRKTKKVR